MTAPDEDRLEEVEDKIESARRQAQDHGTIDGKDEQSFIDPDEDGRDEGVAQGLVP